MGCLLCSELAHDSNGGGSADSIRARIEHGAYIGELADAARSLYAASSAGYSAQQCDVGSGCPSRGKSGRCLQEVCASLDCDLGSAEFLFDAEQSCFENHLKERSVVMGYGGYGVNRVLHGLMIAAFQVANRYDHVEFARAQAYQGGCFLAER